MVGSFNNFDRVVMVVPRREPAEPAAGDPMFSSRVLNHVAKRDEIPQNPASCRYLLHTMAGGPNPNPAPTQPPLPSLSKTQALNFLA